MAAPAWARQLRRRRLPQGYVWRVRSRPTTSSSRPSSACRPRRRTTRRPPTASPARPDTCLNGYVWREAVATITSASFRRDASRARRQRPCRRPAQLAARLAHPIPPVRAALHWQPLLAALRRRPALPRPRRPHQPRQRHRDRALERPGPVKSRSWSRPVARTRMRRAACSSSPAECCAARAALNGYFAVRDPGSVQLVGPRARPHRLRHALARPLGAPPALREGGPAALRDAWFRQRGENGAAWARTRRGCGAVACGGVRVCIAFGGVRSGCRPGARAPMRLAGVPGVRLTRPST